MSRIARIKNFFSEVRSELTKVSWPTRYELVGSTAAVFISVFVLAFFLGICDFFLSRILNVIVR